MSAQIQPQAVDSDPRPAPATGAEASPALPMPSGSNEAPVVNAAHIVNQTGQTEIRIEMQADSLGGVELRAHLAGDQIGASIAVEHHDAQIALASELPALHSALVAKDLRVEMLSVTHGAFSSLGGGHEQQAGQRGQTQYPVKLVYAEQAEPPQSLAEVPAEPASLAYSAGGLSVVA
jgi:flagellar hook-length control protein FliK